MKLATALSERADLQRRISELSVRLNNNAKVQEGAKLARENNIETSKKISEIKPDIKIIITSGDENYEAEAMAAGASYFISMPVTVDNLKKCLQEI